MKVALVIELPSEIRSGVYQKDAYVRIVEINEFAYNQTTKIWVGFGGTQRFELELIKADCEIDAETGALRVPLKITKEDQEEIKNTSLLNWTKE